MSMMSWAQTKWREMEKICVKIMTHHLFSQVGIQKTLPLRESVWSITDLSQNVLFLSLAPPNKMGVCLIYCDCQLKCNTYMQTNILYMYIGHINTCIVYLHRYNSYVQTYKNHTIDLLYVHAKVEQNRHIFLLLLGQALLQLKHIWKQQ